MRDMERIARLVAMVCLALVWAYLVGEHKDINIKPIRILKHGRKAKSLVKYGLEEISTILLRPTYTPKFDIFKFLSVLKDLVDYQYIYDYKHTQKTIFHNAIYTEQTTKA